MESDMSGTSGRSQGHVLEAAAHFPAEGPSARGARRFVASTLATWKLRHLVELACLLVGELVANVLLHAGTDFDIRLRSTEGSVRVEVHDGSARLPVRKYYSSTSTTGRGLLLVGEMARTWGAETEASGKVVWFELDVATGVTPSAAFSSTGLDDRADRAGVGGHLDRPG
jgi:hypothetical protein